ncbi:MAG: hypothetical protein V4723_12340 [Pseudomonadota bacterium]
MSMHDYRDYATADSFDALRRAMATQDAPKGVEKELMAAFAKAYPKRRWYQLLSPAQWGLAGGVGSTALVAVMALVLTMHAPLRSDASAALDGGDFIALTSMERIEQEPSPRMVQTEVPRAELDALGVAVSPENAGESVRAEMLVGADGSPLALRLVSLP